MSNYLPIKLTGNVYVADRLISASGVRVPSTPKAGDLKLWDRADRDKSTGGFATSGYFNASIYDGKKWRNFRLWNLMSSRMTKFSTQDGKWDKIPPVIALLRGKAESYAVWGHKTYVAH